MISIIDEERFQRFLTLERRRCERSGARYGVVLVDLSAPSRHLGVTAIDEIGAAVESAMRETDVTGWYRQSTTIGVILTTLNSERSVIEAVVLKRIKDVLVSHLSATQLEYVSFSCYFFPEDGGAGVGGGMSREGKASAAAKRAVDLLGSLTALMLLSPLFLLAMILIKLTSQGPVFFKQKRVGRNGQEFTFLKFRSMVVNNDSTIHKEYVQNLIERKNNGVVYKMTNDPRITPIGRFLRRTSLDELPQFLNALTGDMSLVGPRPPIPYELEKYALWHRRRVLEAKPGITGSWQVQGRSRTTFDEMVRMDLRYIRNRSFWLDLKILLKTPYAVLRGNGAY